MVEMKDLYRLSVYEPDGGFKDYLYKPLEWQGSLPINDLGSLKVKCAAGSDEAALLADPCEVVLEVWNGSRYVEPENARYMRVESMVDVVSGDVSSVDYTLVSYGRLTDYVVVVPKKFGMVEHYDEDGKRKFLSANAGQILATVLSEARGLVDGLVPGVELGFTPTRDSAGHAWTKTHTLYFEPGVSLLTILQNLSGQGFVDWWFEGRRLMVVNAESRTKPSKQTLIPLGASEAPVRSTIGGLIHTALLVGDEGNVWRVDNSAGTPAPWGKTMKVLTQGGVKEERTAREMIQAELDAGSRERFEYTWQKPVADLDWTPLVDVRPGDWVSYRTAHGVEPVRVFQVTLSGTGRNVKVALTLNDRFEDAQVRQVKRIKGIVNGAHGDAGTGSAPTKADKAEPAQPVGLVAESEGYWEGDEARSLVRVGFSPVTLDVHGLAIRIAEYEVNVGGKVVHSKSHTNVLVDGFTPNKGVSISVVAVSSEGIQSKALVGRVTTVAPDEKLAPPTRLTGGADYGVVELTWDGKLHYVGGQPYDPPAHFAYIEVEESADQRTWKVVGTARAGGLMLDRQSVVGQTRYYRAWSVDRLRRRSDDSSPVTTVKVTSKVRAEIDAARQKIADELKTAEVDISRLAASPGNTFKNGVIQALAADRAFARELVSRKILVGTPNNPIRSVGIADGAVTADKVQASTGLIQKLMTESLMAGKITSRMFSTDAGFKGPNLDINRYRIRATDSSNRETFSIGTNGEATFSGNITSRAKIEGASIVGSVIKTSNSSSRVQMDMSGLTSYMQNRKAMQLDNGRLMFWDGDKYIGQFANQRWKANPSWRGISMNLDYEGFYLDMAYLPYKNAPNYISVFRVDPWGYTNGGAKGINIDLPIVCGTDATDDFWQRLKFTLANFNGWSYPALMQEKGKTGIAFGTGGLYFIQGNTLFSLESILKKIGMY
ncbi:hypothetical protein [Arcanobacterium buesumense]|uniref:Prophage tail endopeptidase domain-containing protein n=1 Tax=Arcanobacterium buesumense TaxID=2722751 RepID=A0A6H2ELR3_9ACTO|nr:hypothetical protein [Arcanobacterium buesumense]QJC22002.1 hypothetical protein HC352_05465 [Arcanobacterium buesumense]